MIRQLDLFAPPVIERPATLAAGVVFNHAGRALLVHRIYGTDAAAPVIVVELTDVGAALQGQYSLWSLAGVMRAIKSPSIVSQHEHKEIAPCRK